MPVVSNVHLKLAVVNRRELGNDSMSVMFKRPIGFEYEAGDWIDLMQPGVTLPGGKTYSLSSSPTESELAIMFRKGQSPLKQRLQTLQPGNALVVTQYGNDYDFRLRDNRSSVLIAGGIGIAPFRSMLKEMADTKSQNQVQLLYFNKGSDFLLSEELNQWACSLQIDIKYFDTNELKRKDRLKIFKTVMNHNAHHFFIAGPESMVESTEHLLIDDLGIDVKDIRIDRFGGY